MLVPPSSSCFWPSYLPPQPLVSSTGWEQMLEEGICAPLLLFLNETTPFTAAPCSPQLEPVMYWQGEGDHALGTDLVGGTSWALQGVLIPFCGTSGFVAGTSNSHLAIGRWGNTHPPAPPPSLCDRLQIGGEGANATVGRWALETHDMPLARVVQDKFLVSVFAYVSWVPPSGACSSAVEITAGEQVQEEEICSLPFLSHAKPGSLHSCIPRLEKNKGGSKVSLVPGSAGDNGSSKKGGVTSVLYPPGFTPVRVKVFVNSFVDRCRDLVLINGCSVWVILFVSSVSLVLICSCSFSNLPVQIYFCYTGGGIRKSFTTHMITFWNTL